MGTGSVTLVPCEWETVWKWPMQMGKNLFPFAIHTYSLLLGARPVLAKSGPTSPAKKRRVSDFNETTDCDDATD